MPLQYLIPPVACLIFTLVILVFFKSSNKTNYLAAFSVLVVCAFNVWLLESHIIEALPNLSGVLKLLAVTLALSVSPFIAVLTYKFSSSNKLIYSSVIGGGVLFMYPLHALYIICYVSRDCI